MDGVWIGAAKRVVFVAIRTRGFVERVGVSLVSNNLTAELEMDRGRLAGSCGAGSGLGKFFIISLLV